MLKLLLVNILPVQVRQVLVSHGVVRVGHLVVGPDEALVVRRRALLDAVVLLPVIGSSTPITAHELLAVDGSAWGIGPRPSC